MRRSLAFPSILLLAALISVEALPSLGALQSNLAHAQPFRFMDEAGNLHWVDTLEEVPRRYRNQVLAPTPVPTWSGRRWRPPPPTKRPRPTKPPRKSREQIREEKMRRLRGGENKLPLNVQRQEQPAPQLSPMSAPPVQAPPGAPLLPQTGGSQTVQNEVAFEGAKAETSLSIVRDP